MNTSEKIENISKALVEAIGEIPNPPKNAVNPHFKNKYADLAGILDTAKPILKKNGLTVIQSAETDGNLVTVKSRILHVSGEWIESALTLTAQGTDPQKIGSAITYGRRYGISAMLNIAADDDDDGEQNKPKNGLQVHPEKNTGKQTEAQKKNDSEPVLSELDSQIVTILESLSKNPEVRKKTLEYLKNRNVPGGEKIHFLKLTDREKEKILDTLVEKGAEVVAFVEGQVKK